MFPGNDALGDAIIRSAHGADPSLVRHYVSSLHPASMTGRVARVPASKHGSWLTVASMIERATAMLRTRIAPAGPAPVACCPAV